MEYKNVQIERAVWQRAKAHADKHGLKLWALLSQAITAFLDKKEK